MSNGNTWTNADSKPSCERSWPSYIRCAGRLERENPQKSATRGITEATWTSSPKQKSFNGGDSGCVPSCLDGEERLLELFCIFPVTWFMPRGGGGKEPGLSTKNIFLETSLCNNERACLCDLTFFSEKVIFKASQCFEMDLHSEWEVEFLCVGNLCTQILWFRDLLRITACYYRGHNLIKGQGSCLWNTIW